MKKLLKRVNSMISEQDALDWASRKEFLTFVKRAFKTTNPGEHLRQGKHLEALARKLEMVAAGKCKRLIVNMPPRVLKSRITSAAFPAWVLGNHPSTEFLCISHSKPLAQELGNFSLQIMQSDWYRKANPETILAKSRSGVFDFVTTVNGRRKGTSMESNITGHGGDIIIIDDPIDGQKVYSQVERDSNNSKFDNVIQSRLNNPSEGSIILIMQRLHEDDLTGYLQRKYNFEMLTFPLVANDPTTYIIGDWKWNRSAGDILDPEGHTPEWLKSKKQNIQPHIFEAQYQQNPVPPDGLLIKEEWFPLFDHLPKGRYQTIQSWDVAQRPGENSSYSVCSTWKTDGTKHYLVDLWRGKEEYEELLDIARQLFTKHKPQAILIEDAALGTALISTLRRASKERNVSYPIVLIPAPTLPKYERTISHISTLKSNGVLLPTSASWVPAFLQEILRFPNGRFDDQVDSMTQFLLWMDDPKGLKPESSLGNPNIITYKGGYASTARSRARKPNPQRDPRGKPTRRF